MITYDQLAIVTALVLVAIFGAAVGYQVGQLNERRRWWATIRQLLKGQR
jgi:VIT1/CCC1 family predicted Fe2+/Mn2+ transporter